VDEHRPGHQHFSVVTGATEFTTVVAALQLLLPTAPRRHRRHHRRLTLTNATSSDTDAPTLLPTAPLVTDVPRPLLGAGAHQSRTPHSQTPSLVRCAFTDGTPFTEVAVRGVPKLPPPQRASDSWQNTSGRRPLLARGVLSAHRRPCSPLLIKSLVQSTSTACCPARRPPSRPRAPERRPSA